MLMPRGPDEIEMAISGATSAEGDFAQRNIRLWKEEEGLS
jgi:hypothetical protein